MAFFCFVIFDILINMEIDPRSELFNKVIQLVGEEYLDYFSLGSFTKEKSSEALKKLEKSEAPEEEIYEILSLYDDDLVIEEEEEKNTITFVDVTETRYGLSDIPTGSPHVARCIAYLNDLVDSFIKGEAITVGVAAILKDGQATMWIPNGFDPEKVDTVFDPLVEALNESKDRILAN